MNVGVDEQFQGANTAGKLSPYWGEHVARYRFALQYIEDKTVLDLACGTGYGLRFLKQKARTVIGLDANIDAAKKARIESAHTASVVLGDGQRLPFPAEVFDCVTSFETLEHVHDRPRFLKELHRVLKPGGHLILSTPNANYTKPLNGKPSNPFHVFEYTPKELRAELENIFQIESMVGQFLDPAIRIPPFEMDQKTLPKTVPVMVMLFGWKVMNKIPLAVREQMSNVIWNKPFYPTAEDYHFSEKMLETAPVQVALCRK